MMMDQNSHEGVSALELNYSRFIQSVTREMQDAMKAGTIVRATHSLDSLDAAIAFDVQLPGKRLHFELTRETILQ